MSYNGSGTFLINTAGQPVVSGTVISSTAFNALTADLATGLSTAITKDGQTTITANIPMANYKFTGLGVGSAAGDSANLSQVQSTAVKLLASVSGADTITAVGSPNVAAYAAGQMFYFVAAGANTGAVTINIDSLGAKSITRDGTTALAAGDIQSGEVCVIVYDGTQFQLVNGASQSASIVTENLTVNKATVLNESGGDNDTRIEGDTDSNLLFVDASTDRIGVGTNAPSNKLTVSGNADITGNVGIGTSSPSYKLEVASGSTDASALFNSTSANGSHIRLASSGTVKNYIGCAAGFITDGAADDLGLRAVGKISFATNGAGADMLLDSSGNLGLGVTPSFKLDISGGGTTAKINTLDTNDGGASLSTWMKVGRRAGTGTNAYINTLHDGSDAVSALTWAFGTSSTGTEVMRLTAGGDLGVGTSSPTTFGAGSVLVTSSGTTTYGGFIGSTNNVTVQMWADEGSAAGSMGTRTNHAIRFTTNNTERARIASGGDMMWNGTNTTTQNGNVGFVYKFFGGANNVIIPLESSASNKFGILEYRRTGRTSGRTSQVSIGENASDQGEVQVYSSAANADISGGVVLANGATSWSAISDMRLKTVTGTYTNALKDIAQIQAIKFTWKYDQSNTPQVGVSAQSVERVVPEAISHSKNVATLDDETEYLAVRYTELIPLMIASIQELKSELDEAKAKIAQLEAK